MLFPHNFIKWKVSFDLFYVILLIVLECASPTTVWCLATADRAAVLFVKEFQWDQSPQPLQNGLFHYSQKKLF